MDDEEEKSFSDEFLVLIRKKASRRRRALKESGNIWFGLGTSGMVGWSVAIPTVLGALAGSWLDANTQSEFSWVLTLMIGGLILGCLNAWYWVSKESKHLREERERYYDD